MSITLEQAQARLDAYLAAELAVLQKQSYEIAGRKLTYADLGEIREGIKEASAQVSVLTGRASSRGRSRTILVA